MADVELGLALERLRSNEDWKYLKQYIDDQIETYMHLAIDGADEEERFKGRILYHYNKEQLLDGINELIESALSEIEDQENKREEA